ncbi:hypothetical protein G3489_19400 [Shewanella baltica]|uniref:hypothetical protein n=1 Tax=Shewanella baltica TaxID=62322 RepID=UPI00217E438B|nr:hypothetical protein [Shewanella baltica]MCS6271843.1 hypothetical protein [Shewanella baltica]
MLTEEQKLSCSTGELIHGLGNLIADETIKLGNLTTSDGQLLQELGCALRQRQVESSDSFPALNSAGIKPSKMTRSELVDLADSIINRALDRE